MFSPTRERDTRFGNYHEFRWISQKVDKIAQVNIPFPPFNLLGFSAAPTQLHLRRFARMVRLSQPIKAWQMWRRGANERAVDVFETPGSRLMRQGWWSSNVRYIYIYIYMAIYIYLYMCIYLYNFKFMHTWYCWDGIVCLLLQPSWLNYKVRYDTVGWDFSIFPKVQGWVVRDSWKEPFICFVNLYIHYGSIGMGIFTYMNGSFLW